MGKSERKRALLAEYKARPLTGGVCAIRNTATGRILLSGAVNADGYRNRFEFSVSSGSCVQPALSDDWAEYGAGSFAFQILEELKKTPEQSDKAFQKDLETLTEIWREKLEKEGVSFY